MSDISKRIRSLKVEFLDGDCGPYEGERIRRTEEAVKRKLDVQHRAILTAIGGTFGFEHGVEVGDLDVDLSVFFGVGDDDYNIVDWWRTYSGQIPEGWYPFGKDSEGNLFLLASNGAVYHVELDEELWSRDRRPESAGRLIAADFGRFVDQLRFPDWVTKEEA